MPVEDDAPGGATLAAIPSELPWVTLPQHGTTRYLHVRVGVRDGRMRWVVPRTLVGLVPVGTRSVVVPVGEVASLRVGRRLPPLRGLVALVVIVVAVATLPWWVERVAQQLAGHADAWMTREIYTHVTAPMFEAAASAISHAVDGAFGSSADANGASGSSDPAIGSKNGSKATEAPAPGDDPPPPASR